VNLSASTAVSDTINAVVSTDPESGDAASNGQRAVVTGFTNFVSGNRGAADVLSETGHQITVYANTAAATTVAGNMPFGAQYTVSDGVFTMTKAGTGQGFNELADVQALVNAKGANETAIVGIAGNTYIITSGAADTLASDTIIQLNGVTGITGFASSTWDGVSTSSGNTIAIANADANLAGVLANDQGSGSVSTTFNQSGDAVDTLTVSALTANVVNTYNLANFATLVVNGVESGSNFTGSVVVNQVGASPELLVTTATEDGINPVGGAFAVASLTTNGAVVLDAADGNSITIGSLINSTNAEKTVYLAGNAAITIGAVSDTALTTIDASASTGNVMLGGDGLAHDAGALTTAGLTILGGSGDLTAFASGAADHISGFSLTVTASGNGDVITTSGATGDTGAITASGNADTITVGSALHEAGAYTISANGVQDVISVFSTGSTIVGAAGNDDTITLADNNPATFTLTGSANGVLPPDTTSPLPVQLGNGDTINIGVTLSPSSELAANAALWAGQNATINLSAHSTADIFLQGDVVGAGASPLETVINGVVASNEGHLTLNLDTAQAVESWAGGSSENSQVNVSGVSSLAAALNLAASQAAVLDTQFHGNDNSVGGAINPATGLVDWFQYGGNTYIVEANNTSTVLPGAHTALGSHDIVVELTGIVDVNHIHLNTHSVL
jgi:hypothetical protein